MDSPVLTGSVAQRPGASRWLGGRLRGAEGDGCAGVQRQQRRAAVGAEHGARQGARERDAVEEGRGEVPVAEKGKVSQAVGAAPNTYTASTLSMGFSRQEYWGGLPCPPSGDLPDPLSLTSPTLVGEFFMPDSKPKAGSVGPSPRSWPSAAAAAPASPLRGTLGSSLRSPVEVEGNECFPPQPKKDLASAHQGQSPGQAL